MLGLHRTKSGATDRLTALRNIVEIVAIVLAAAGRSENIFDVPRDRYDALPFRAE